VENIEMKQCQKTAHARQLVAWHHQFVSADRLQVSIQLSFHCF